MPKIETDPKDAGWELDLGANRHPEGGTLFRVWAPYHLSLGLKVQGKTIRAMERDALGYFSLKCPDVHPGDVYSYVLENGLERPDPAARALNCGVHSAAVVVDPIAYSWNDASWCGIDIADCIFYELHIGTFTPEGTFDAAIEKFDYLKELGVNCIEIMPLFHFPGRWNWGYDGAFPFAPFSGYGGVEGLKRLVDAAHQADLAVALDVVYNHLGPEGNCFTEFGPYLSESYHTPWGKALNYDGPYSDPVRDFFIKNALHWVHEYHIDILRLDAIHGIYDFSAQPMLPELIEAVKAQSERVHVVAECDRNDAKVIRSAKLDALWNDDVHHALHVALTGEREAYYSDFQGLADLVVALKRGFVYEGKYSPYRRRRHGNSAADIPLEQLIVFSQNHDQTGNRPLGERLFTLVGKKRAKLAAAFTLLTPFIPLLFMGEEYGESAPFEYFVDFSDEKLMRSIYEGRKREFKCLLMPFPGRESFENSRLTWEKDQELLAFYKQLIALRKRFPPRIGIVGEEVDVASNLQEEWIAWEYPTRDEQYLGVCLYLGEKKGCLHLPFKDQGELLLCSGPNEPLEGGEWEVEPDTVLVFRRDLVS